MVSTRKPVSEKSKSVVRKQVANDVPWEERLVLQIDALLAMKNVTPAIPNLARALLGDSAAVIRGLMREAKREERAHEQTVDDRDIAQATADRLAGLISEITGIEIGEHSSGLGCPGNDPHLNAIDAAEGFLRKRAAQPQQGAQS